MMYGDCSSEVITLQCCSYDAVRGVRGCQSVSARINNVRGKMQLKHNNTLIARSAPGMTHSPASDASDQCLTERGGEGSLDGSQITINIQVR